MSEPTVTITKAEYDALQKVAVCWDENCFVWKQALTALESQGYWFSANAIEEACNAMDSAVAEAVRKEKKA